MSHSSRGKHPTRFSLRRRIQVLMLASSGGVLALTCATVLTYDLLSYRRDLGRELTALGDMLARTSSAPLAFGARQEAEELLAALAPQQTITAAALYDAEGNLFAQFAERRRPPASLNAPEQTGLQFSGGTVAYVAPVQGRERRLGTLFVQGTLEPWRDRLWLYAGLVLVVAGAAFALAVLLSRRLGRNISAQIEELASTARAVSDKGDYAVRACRLGDDELGDLTDAVNEMLAKIHDRDRQLRDNEERLRSALQSGDLEAWRRRHKGSPDPRS